jgi:hypothetical protein
MNNTEETHQFIVYALVPFEGRQQIRKLNITYIQQQKMDTVLMITVDIYNFRTKYIHRFEAAYLRVCLL